MKILIMALPLALSLAACETRANDPYGQGPYGPGSYPAPQQYPEPYPQPYPPQSYPQSYPQPYPPQGYPQPYPGAMAAPSLAQTNWRVLSINGRPVPASGYYLNFQPDRLSAKLGCNTLGAGYSVQGDFLIAGAVMATRMSCPDMGFEREGVNILSQPMRIAMIGGDRMSLSNAAGTIEALRAR